MNTVHKDEDSHFDLDNFVSKLQKDPKRIRDFVKGVKDAYDLISFSSVQTEASAQASSILFKQLEERNN